MLSHPISKYPETARFAQAHPLPRDPLALGERLLDVAAIARCCLAESRRWDAMTLQVIHHDRASPYPGAFLSNPAMLLSASTTEPYVSHTSYGAGCFFSYSHYQEDSLGTALLLGAFSPRTFKPALSARDYARALLALKEQRLISDARLSSAEGVALEQFAVAKTRPGAGGAFMSMELHAEHFPALGHLRADASARAIELALTDDKPGLFTDEQRDRLRALVASRAAIKLAGELSEISRLPEATAERALAKKTSRM